MSNEISIKGAARDELIVVLHGLSKSPADMQGVINSSHEARPDADILALPLPYGGRCGIVAVRSAARIAADVAERIEAAIKEHREDKERPGDYRRFILVGHSFGGVLARKVAIIANGEQPDAPFEPPLDGSKGRDWRNGTDWGPRIERIILLAGMSRGWLPESARDWKTAAIWTVGSWLGELLNLFSLGFLQPTISGIRQGAAFIVQTRLQWLALTKARSRHPSPHMGSPPASENSEPDASILCVQLLGAADDLVAPDDSVDFACDLSDARGAPFVLVELPFATHENAHVMTKPTHEQREQIERVVTQDTLVDVCKQNQLIFQARWILFGRAVSQSRHQLKEIAIDPKHMTDMPALRPDFDVGHVVFVIHGIRDHGFWTQKIARVIKKEAEKTHKHFRSFTGSYGYFAMVPFVLPWVRRWKSEWLMDRYVEARALYPNAHISFVGHSNGTYLLARALRDYPAVRFERVVLAGSVIRRDFDWMTQLTPVSNDKPPRVSALLNYVATHDWVVAIFSKAFQPFRFVFDLGSAGHDGFNQYKCRHPRLFESHYIEGSHSAALAETQWDDIARFIVSGTPIPGPPDGDFKRQRRWWMVALGWLSTALVIGLIVAVVWFGIFLTKSAFSASGQWVTTGLAAACIIYWWIVYIVATRF
jgi:pimeloyl-ACP methyl ester carboxylesterase